MVIELARALSRGGDPACEETSDAGTADSDAAGAHAGTFDAGTFDAGTAGTFDAGTTSADGGATESAPRAGAGAGATSTVPAWQAVEAAFLDVVHPDIAQGYAALVRAGCSEIIAHPFFLFEGNHTTRDIPAALAAAQAEHPTTRWTITRPLGLHPGVVQAVRARIDDAVGRPGADYDPGVGRPVTSSPTTAASG
ncbi:cobalamin biosynthesis protein CbiX [Frankia sp. R43]|uniref:sirohydrochlorin chelatase n=1 Tax=Frankia sp. R43 TaxID=269536 RepID=UPI0006C9FF15|nr:CbiX/SirB N-terminal domain-containing protein [Frankia sp. R43]KPM51501.1 cobalamin biosynthesis protein CbiX [Frankia sp. R43]